MIKERSLNTSSYMSKVVSRPRSYAMENMEKLLLVWIEDCNQKKISLSQKSIRSKAKGTFFHQSNFTKIFVKLISRKIYSNVPEFTQIYFQAFMIESKLLKKLMETFPKRLKSMNYFMLALDGLKDFDIELDLIILTILMMIGI